MLGRASFHLGFHLAYLVLRETDSTTSTTDNDDRSKKAARDSSIDISFLDLESSCGPSSSRYHVRKANISIVTCGWSNTQWTSYAFANTRPEEEGDEEEEEEDYELFKQDFFAAEDGLDYAMDANRAEWDARRYWLRIVAIRCQLVLKEWQYLVHTIEEGIEAWVSFCSTAQMYDLAHHRAANKGSMQRQHRRVRLRPKSCTQLFGSDDSSNAAVAHTSRYSFHDTSRLQEI